MARNQKLSPLLAGRAVAAVEPPAPAPAPAASPFAPSQGGTWHVRFDDGSVLAVRTDGSAPTGGDAKGAVVAEVGQKGTTLTLTFAAEGGVAPLVFRTAEASGCVLLRDGQGRMAYAD